ncbi:GNAT family N-acetyltransferase [Candidatus Gracilibacteria bacterium]|nr:GNAT family N-acetyltransferase [Candidatus Gracilibacteria bacterium]
MDLLTLSQRCEASANGAAARSRVVADVGPFRALIDSGIDLIWLNYAVPIGPIDNTVLVTDALEELRRVFLAYQRRLRFEFNALPWPGLAAVLEQHGLEHQLAAPLMVCTPETLIDFAQPTIVAQVLGASASDEELRALLGIQREAFGGAELVTQQEIAETRSKILAGAELYGLALVDNIPAAAAVLSDFAAVGELVGVGTAAAYRRRGAAATLSATLTRHYFNTLGNLAWLSAGDAGSQAVYERVGYRVIDQRLNYIAPEI